MLNLDRIILSSNLDPMYFEFIPFITRTWKKLCNVKVSMAILNNDDINLPTIREQCKECDEIIFYKSIQGIPDANLSKVLRLFTAMKYENEICMINDVDLFPLHTKYVRYLIEQRKPDQLLCVGANVYVGTKDEGKFPMGYLTSEGRNFKSLVNPNNLSYEEIVKSWIGTKVFDSQEDISSNINHEVSNCFSDESLMRVLISKWEHKNKVKHIPRTFIAGIGSIDRGRWKIIPEMLERNHYVEVHALRPYSRYKEQMDIIFKYLGVL